MDVLSVTKVLEKERKGDCSCGMFTERLRTGYVAYDVEMDIYFILAVLNENYNGCFANGGARYIAVHYCGCCGDRID